MSNHESYAIGLIDLVDSTGYYPEGGDPLGKEAKRRHNEISSYIFKKYNLQTEPPKGDGFLFWGKDPIQTCLASIEVIKRIKTEVLHYSQEEKKFTMATKIVLTKGLIETGEDKKDITHGHAAHKCQRIMEAAWQKHHTILIDSLIFDEIKNHLNDSEIIYSGPYKLQVEEFGQVEVYQISDKELGLMVDPTRDKLRTKIQNEINKKVEDTIEQKIQSSVEKSHSSFRKKIITMSVIIGLLLASMIILIALIPSYDQMILEKEVENTIKTMDNEVKNASFMIFETSQNDLMKQPLLKNYTDNFPIMILEKDYKEKGVEKQRIDLITTVVDGMDTLYYLFVVPPEGWEERLQCRLYVIYPVGALIPGEDPGFLKQRDWCENKDEFEMYLSSTYWSRGQKVVVPTMIAPIFDENKQEVGYLGGAINFEKMLKDALSKSEISNFGYILVDHDKCIVTAKYKNGSTINDVWHFGQEKLYNFNSGTIDLEPNEARCQNNFSAPNNQGKIQIITEPNNPINGRDYRAYDILRPEITKPEIDVNNFLEDWKLIVIQPT